MKVVFLSWLHTERFVRARSRFLSAADNRLQLNMGYSIGIFIHGKPRRRASRTTACDRSCQFLSGKPRLPAINKQRFFNRHVHTGDLIAAIRWRFLKFAIYEIIFEVSKYYNFNVFLNMFDIEDFIAV